MADDSKLHIDADWKAQAQAEREKLRQSEQQAQAQQGQGEQAGEGGQGEGEGEMPPANFDTLIQTLATNALLAMGAVPDPQTGQRYAHMGLARHHIDMLGVLHEKTKGNLSDEEDQTLSTTLYELRNAFVQLSQQAQAMAQQQGGQGGGQGGAQGGGPGNAGGIQTPGGAGPQPGPGMQGPGGVTPG
ncbi:MAG: DUF1844 domain-containing protein [Spirochaetes bacterium]|jgi:hypothetical protein|nr:DUF1844 domain-containing protein [Spirochaetota bacterium]